MISAKDVAHFDQIPQKFRQERLAHGHGDVKLLSHCQPCLLNTSPQLSVVAHMEGASLFLFFFLTFCKPCKESYFHNVNISFCFERFLSPLKGLFRAPD